jgi:DNA-binding MltR family transcriptional regulator
MPMKKERRLAVDEVILTPEEMRAEIRRLTKLNEALEEQTKTYVFGNTQIMDEDGNLLAVLEGDVNRVVIKEAIERHVNTILEEFLKSEDH